MRTTTDRRNRILAAGLAVAGLAMVVALFFVQGEPRPIWLWLVLTTAYVVLQFSAVEVSDRLFISSSMMVAFTAAVVFGRGSAVLAVVLMAAAAVLHPDDLRKKRWIQPAVNFGQLVISATIGVAVFVPFLPRGELTSGDLPVLAVGAAVAAVAYDWVNFWLVRFIVRRLYPGRTLQPWSRMLPHHVALAVLGGFGGLLGAAYLLVGPVVLPLIGVTYLIGHVGFGSYSRLREAQEDTIRGFVKAVEALDPYTRGHTERVAGFVRLIGERLGFDPAVMERMRWVALIHDVGKVAVPAELLHRSDYLTDAEYRTMIRHMRVVEEVLARVDFLGPMVGVLASHHALLEGAPGVGVEARVLAVADAFDAMTSARSYRAAVTQTTAFDLLRQRSALYGAEVVDALIGAVETSGEIYGSPDEESAEEVERLVRERAIRA